MPNCPKCNSMVAPGSRFCPGCGNPMSSSTQCPSCGAEVAPGAAFCTKCGTRIAATPQPAAYPGYQPAAPHVAPAPVAAPGIALGSSIPAMPQQPVAHPGPAPRPAASNPVVAPVEGAQLSGLQKGLKVATIFNIVSLVLTISGGLSIVLSFILYADDRIYPEDFGLLFFFSSLLTVPAIIGLVKTGKIKRDLRNQIAQSSGEI